MSNDARSPAEVAQDASGAPLAMPEPAWQCPARCAPSVPGVHGDDCWYMGIGPALADLRVRAAEQAKRAKQGEWQTSAESAMGRKVPILLDYADRQRARADRAETALAAFQRYTGHADAVSLAAAIKAAEGGS